MSLLFFRGIDYAQRKSNQTLDFHKTFSRVSQQSKKVTWTYASKDQSLRDGYHVIITNKKVQGYVVADLSTKALGIDEAYIPTTTPNHPGPVARSVFVIRKAEKADMFGSDDIIRYGQKVKIEVN